MEGLPAGQRLPSLARLAGPFSLGSWAAGATAVRWPRAPSQRCLVWGRAADSRVAILGMPAASGRCPSPALQPPGGRVASRDRAGAAGPRPRQSGWARAPGQARAARAAAVTRPTRDAVTRAAARAAAMRPRPGRCLSRCGAAGPPPGSLKGSSPPTHHPGEGSGDMRTSFTRSVTEASRHCADCGGLSGWRPRPALPLSQDAPPSPASQVPVGATRPCRPAKVPRRARRRGNPRGCPSLAPPHPRPRRGSPHRPPRALSLRGGLPEQRAGV